MVTLGTAAGGGGSIARIDVDSKGIKVGPESAGALPGPAAYDLGGVEPTLADADLVLGYLDPDYFLGGRKKLTRDKAVNAVNSRIATGLGITVEEAAWRTVQSSEDDVARQIEKEIGGKGLKPGSLILFAFGGGGGLRCCSYASRLGISRVIVFSFNAVASAFGASTMDILHAYERPTRVMLKSADDKYIRTDWQTFNEAVAEMTASAERDMRAEGFSPEALSFTLELGLRGAGGFHWIESPMIRLEKVTAAKSIGAQYAKMSGNSSGELRIERITLEAVCTTPHYQLPVYDDRGPDHRSARKGIRDVFWGKGYLGTDIYERDLLECGNRVEGPAVIESPDTTYVIPSGWSYTVDKYRNGIIELI
jgi:N-methylhydantoinase A/acetophenone carboxylase